MLRRNLLKTLFITPFAALFTNSAAAQTLTFNSLKEKYDYLVSLKDKRVCVMNFKGDCVHGVLAKSKYNFPYHQAKFFIGSVVYVEGSFISPIMLTDFAALFTAVRVEHVVIKGDQIQIFLNDGGTKCTFHQ